jgi:hypothetical protein
MNELTAFQTQAANMALHKLLNGRTFYLSDFNGLAKLIGVQLGGADYQALSGLHCMEWADMPEQLRTQAKEKIVELLGLPPMVMEAEKTSPKQPPQEQAQKLKLAFWR